VAGQNEKQSKMAADKRRNGGEMAMAKISKRKKK
jgi:hypothetical protein